MNQSALPAAPFYPWQAVASQKNEKPPLQNLVISHSFQHTAWALHALQILASENPVIFEQHLYTQKFHIGLLNPPPRFGNIQIKPSVNEPVTLINQNMAFSTPTANGFHITQFSNAHHEGCKHNG